MIGVVASTLWKAKAYAQEHNLGREQVDWIGISRGNQVRGCRLTDVTYVPGWDSALSDKEIEQMYMAIEPALIW